MAQILVGQFDDFDSAEAAASELRSLGIAQGDMEVYAFNAPGQHDQTPIGGDEDADRGARKGDEGALAGAAIGGAAGLALGAAAIRSAGPVAVAAGLAVGAYTGAFAGAVNKLGNKPARAWEIPARPAGVRLAAHILSPSYREHVIAAFHRHNVRSIEEADGMSRDGKWADFDPVSVPKWLLEPPQVAAPQSWVRLQPYRKLSKAEALPDCRWKDEVRVRTAPSPRFAALLQAALPTR